jgi:hypothetical protein
VDLTGCIDLHLHSGPDVRPRMLDDIDLARAAKAAGYRAILLKSHHTVTADRATIAEKVVGGIRVFGGLALNWPTGGINPDAVDFALRIGARQVWFPTYCAVVEHGHKRGKRFNTEPVRVLDGQGRVLPAVREVLALLRDAGAILGTGHLGTDEVKAVVAEARAMGLEKILVTHPEHPFIRMSVADQRALAAQGCLFERCYCFVENAVPTDTPVTVKLIAAQIKEVGVESTVLSSDLGRADLSHPVAGYRSFYEQLAAEGFSREELRLMCADTAARLLDL